MNFGKDLYDTEIGVSGNGIKFTFIEKNIVNDEINTNNGDSRKVLNTVLIQSPCFLRIILMQCY